MTKRPHLLAAFCLLFLTIILSNQASALYDPGVGRFCSRDPIGYVADLLLFRYVKGSPLNYVDPSGRLGHIAGGALLGCGVQGVWSITHSLIVGDSFCSCGCKATVSCFFGAIGGALAAAAPTYAGCIYGIASGLASSASKQLCKVACSEGNANVTCAVATALVTGIVGCAIQHAAGGSSDSKAVLERFLWQIVSRILGHDIAGFCEFFVPVGPPPAQAGVACCTFESGGTIWSQSVDVHAGEGAANACARRARGWLWNWNVLGARDGGCT